MTTTPARYLRAASVSIYLLGLVFSAFLSVAAGVDAGSVRHDYAPDANRINTYIFLSLVLTVIWFIYAAQAVTKVFMERRTGSVSRATARAAIVLGALTLLSVIVQFIERSTDRLSEQARDAILFALLTALMTGFCAAKARSGWKALATSTPTDPRLRASTGRSRSRVI